MGWLTPAILVLRKLKQEDGNKFKASLGGQHSEFQSSLRYTVDCLKKEEEEEEEMTMNWALKSTVQGEILSDAQGE